MADAFWEPVKAQVIADDERINAVGLGKLRVRLLKAVDVLGVDDVYGV